MAAEDLVKSIGDNLGRIFRHMLPGLLVVGAARASHPSWFAGIDFSNPWQLLAIAAVAVIAGNTWYVFHRYVVHQLIDFFLYWAGWGGPAKAKDQKLAYFDDLAKYIVNGYRVAEVVPGLRDQIVTRSSHIIFMFIASEVAMFFALPALHETTSFFGRHSTGMFWIGLIGFLASVVQHIIARHIDGQSVQTYQKKTAVPEATTTTVNSAINTVVRS